MHFYHDSRAGLGTRCQARPIPFSQGPHALGGGQGKNLRALEHSMMSPRPCAGPWPSSFIHSFNKLLPI